MSLDEFTNKKSEEKNPNEKYPIIWKSTKCQIGECRAMRDKHRWAIPTGAPNGLMTECYDCHKTNRVFTNSDPDVWVNNKGPSEYVRKRLLTLNGEKTS